jgi:hypothetical protein
MEMYNWLSEKTTRGEWSEKKGEMSPILEKYFSVETARNQREILTIIPRDLADRLSNFDRKSADGLKSGQSKEDPRARLLYLYHT